MACDSDSTFTAKRSKVKVTQAALAGLYWQANMDIELVTDTDACSKMYVYRGTTCRPGRGRIVAAAYLQLVKLTDWGDYIERLCTENMHISYNNNNIIIRAFVRRTMSASELNLRRRQSLGGEDG